jgi:phosphate ABC transporter phosphate-binding protein
VWALVLITAASALVILVPVTSADASGPAIAGTGSSYAALAIIQWDAEVASPPLSETVNYSTQSSVIGLNDFAQYPLVDFGASEIGYSSGQAGQEPPSGFNYQYLPDIAGATCMDYNLTSTVGSAITNLKLNSAVLVGMFTGAITFWDDSAIKALNPGILLPHTPIVVVNRSDASGDNYIFSDYLTTTQGAAWSAFTSAVRAPNGAQAIWPTPPSGERSTGIYNFGNWTNQGGSDTAADFVYSNPGAITYVETGYALLHHDPCAQVQNASGTFIAPSEQADAVALQNDQLQPDLEQNLTPVFQSPQAGAYPISAYSYLVMAQQSEIPTTKQSVEAQYIQFIACNGQKAAGVLGYSPLPLNLVQADFDAVGRITGTPIPPPTASNCGDPYITGSFNPPASSGPTISNTPTGSSGSTGGAAVSPVAAAGGSKAPAGSSATVAHGSAGGGSVVGTSASSGTTGTAGSSSTGALVGTSTSTTTVPTAPGQTPGEAMQKTSASFLSRRGPTLVVVLATLLFVGLLALPPVLASRRRGPRNPDSQMGDS